MLIHDAHSLTKKPPFWSMPSAAEHHAKAVHNRAFLATITDPAFCDWMAVAAFYIAVHLVERVLALQGHHNKDHRGRNKAVRTKLRQIHSHYRALYNLSMVPQYKEVKGFKWPVTAVQSI